jgi:hypothetical protein
MTINYYEGSYQFKTEHTQVLDLDNIRYNLERQSKYRRPIDSLWATVTDQGTEISRYEYIDGRLMNI